ncbi:hypothetical protein WOLCODRAFT_66465 [Wolfiporia cocos MD-104 SS10]|uniref:Uncharacterized protein n=1 Tax=Wolfiporia cocos (strain MD-104) TaxID=742152 RepID=A0A2H3J8P4_WOLCO|nr:hypothetical protein WOLCODRAFT_66465 [Wolfiporia cocos MD-104 SS10]
MSTQRNPKTIAAVVSANPDGRVGNEDGKEGTRILSEGKRKGKEVDPENASTSRVDARAGPSKPHHTIRKLIPPRPFPTVPTSVSATGPRSAHSEGRNYICVSRKIPLGAYLRRCKDLFISDGYKSLHLTAMGAAIPHLMQLAVSLPSILPFPPEEVHTEICTGTTEVVDEVIPEDDDEDITINTRGKSTLSVVITVGDGVDEIIRPAKKRRNAKGPASTVAAAGGNPSAARKPHAKTKTKSGASS